MKSTSTGAGVLAGAMAGLVAAWWALSPVAAQAQTGRRHAALCQPDEEAYAGCTLRGSRKLVAFCIARGDELAPTPWAGERPKLMVPKARHLTYRFGRPGRIELTFPRRRAGSARRFHYARQLYARGGLLEFRFRNGGFEYRYISRLIARAQGSGHDNTHRLTILKNGRRIANLKCTDDNQ